MAFFILKIKKEASNETDKSRNEDGVSNGKYQSERRVLSIVLRKFLQTF